MLGGIAYAAGLLPVQAREPQRVAFYAVAPTGLTANARLVPVEDGTDIEVECVYAEGGRADARGELRDYAI